MTTQTRGNATEPAASQFENGLKVTSSARKVIFEVPNEKSTAAFPEGITISPYGQNNVAPVIVVHNHVDTKEDPNGSWQGADGVNGIVIMNNVPEELAEELLAHYAANPTVGGLHAILKHAETTGQVDNYTTEKAFVEKNLSPAGKTVSKFTGVVKRDSRDICSVIKQDGIIWRKVGDYIEHIDTEAILVRDYVTADGEKIDPASIPVV